MDTDLKRMSKQEGVVARQFNRVDMLTGRLPGSNTYGGSIISVSAPTALECCYLAVISFPVWTAQKGARHRQGAFQFSGTMIFIRGHNKFRKQDDYGEVSKTGYFFWQF